MRFYKLPDFKGGWVIGNFTPNILHTKEFEVGYHQYPKGFQGAQHYHKISTEINIIIRGEAVVNGSILKAGDIFVFDPEEISDVYFLKDTELVIIKCPSVPDDKYYP